MSSVLRIFAGEKVRDLKIIEEGSELILGRNLDVDISVSEDPKISGTHLRIRAADGKFELEDLGSTNGTFVNNEAIRNVTLALGEIFRCGGTDFVFATQDANGGEATATMADTAMLSAVAASKAGYSEESAAEIVERFQLQDAFPISPENGEPPTAFVNRLIATKEPNHSLVFMAYALEKRAAVWWLTRCVLQVESLLDENDQKMLELVETWVRQPTDGLRRKAMAHAEAMEMSTPACWAGVGAFWSGGSMAPPDVPAVEPKDNLAGKAISGGAIMASVFHAPEKAPEKQKGFIQLGIEIAEGKLPWD